MLNDLIVAFDGSPAARDALALARRLAADSGARLAVIYVPPGDEPAADDVARVLGDAGRRMADAHEASLRCARAGPVAGALAAAAREADAALIVLGAGRGGRVVPGATTEAVIHAASCPVLVAPGTPSALNAARSGWSPPPVDADTERVARVAAHVARRAAAALRLITVADVAGVPGAPFAAGTGTYVMQANKSRDSAASALDRATRAAGDDVTVERRVAGGRVGGAVAKLSEDADLLVIGSRGYGPLRGVAAGTHTRPIVRAASCPVLVLAHRVSERFDERVVALAAAGARAQPA